MHRASFLYEGELAPAGDSGRERNGMFPPKASGKVAGDRRPFPPIFNILDILFGSFTGCVGHLRAGGFKVRLASSPRAHNFFFPQLWFVYFDLENCVQFLSEHIREMKTSQEVRCLT